MTTEIEKRIKAVQAGRIPAGYKKTPIGVIPKEWNMTSLKDIAIHVIEKNKNNSVHLTLTNSATKGVIKQEDYFDKQISNNENTDGYYLVKDGDFIYNPRISESAPCGPINRSHIGEIGIASPLYTVFRLKENVQNVDYIELYLRSPFWYRYMCGVANYGARHDRMNIINDDLFAMPLPFPPLSEQKRIAEILATQDRLIELKEKLIAEKQSQKKYLVQTLLDEKKDNKKIKVNNVVIDKSKWKTVIIENLFEETCEKNHPNADVLTIIQGVGTVLRDESGRIVIYDRKSLSSYKYVKEGDFIIHLRSFEGGLEVANQDGIVSPAYVILHPKLLVATGYLYALFHTNMFINRIMAPAVEGARDGRSVKYDVLKKQKIYLPSLPEQKAITDVLSAADEEISLLQKGLEQEKLKKKSLMQLLLTGIVRVKNLQESSK